VISSKARRAGNNGRADSNSKFAEAGEAVSRLHLPDAVEAHGMRRLDSQAKQAMPLRNGASPVRVVHFAFGKTWTLLAGDGSPGERKLRETGKLRKRENVEEGADEPVADLIATVGDKPVAGRMVHLLQCFYHPWRWQDDGGPRGRAARIRPISARRVM